MALDTFVRLKSAIADWLDRDDLSPDRLADFVALCESRIWNGSSEPVRTMPLRLRQMETSVRLWVAANSSQVVLPDDFLEVRLLLANSGDLDVSVLAPLSLQQVYQQGHSRTGRPTSYAIQGMTLCLSPIPDCDTALRLLYYAKPRPLGEAATTNWLLAMAPGAYLHGALLEAALYLGDDQRATAAASAFVSQINGLAVSNKPMAAAPAGLAMRAMGATP